jgi:hypothetical protein
MHLFSSDYLGKYLVFFFYPLDFTFVCPTEILAFNDRVKEFKAINAEVRYSVCCEFIVNSVMVFFRVVDRHRFDSETVLIRISILMPKSGAKSGSDAGLASKRCQSTSSYADPIPSFYTFWKIQGAKKFKKLLYSQ